VVLFYLVHKNSHNVRIFVNKIGIFRPAGGDIPRQTRERLIHVSIGRFTVFAHVVLFVVQTPTA
jgi:hypothetical protein